ncbi:MAG: glycosyltransferase [Bacteroidia bacterium]|nr:glycosyltransferase [Bacteroidia bacterium]
MLPVSLIIPAKNEGDNIVGLIQSLRAQTTPPAEIIVVDAGSSDQTAALATQAGARVIQVNQAYPGQARNVGITYAKSDIIALWDASMKVKADTLEKLITPILQNEADLVQGHLDIRPVTLPSAIYFLLLLPPYNHRLPDGKKMYAPPVACTAFHRKLWRAVGGFRSWRAREDSDFRNRIQGLNPRIHYAPEAVSFWEPAESWASLLRKVRLYGRHNILSGEPAQWYSGLIRVYGSYAAISVIAGMFGGVALGLSTFTLAILAGGWLRSLRKIIQHGPYFKEKAAQNPYAPKIMFLTTGLLVATDIASFLGAVDWLLLDKLRLNPELFPEPIVLSELSPTLRQ